MTRTSFKGVALALAIFLSPALLSAGAQATASVCTDGSSSAASGRGACSGHGGVDAKATAKAMKAAKAQAKATAKAAEKSAKAEVKATKAEAKVAASMVTCTDGSKSEGGRGACSGHGGINKDATKVTAKAVKEEAKAEVKATKAEAKATKADAKASTTMVTCTDGTPSAGGRGACSGHGGIAKSNPAQEKAEKAEAKAKVAAAKVGNGSREDNNPAGAIAKCKDGMYSHSASRQGACGHHGGVASWM